MFSHIMVPLDDTDESAAILPFAQDLAGLKGARVTLITVIEPLNILPWLGSHPDREDVWPDEGSPEVWDSDVREIASYLQSIADDLKAAGVTAECVIAEGKPADRIAEQAESRGADLVMMAVHRRSTVRNWLYGSVSEGVMRRCSVPVLLVQVQPKKTRAAHPPQGGSLGHVDSKTTA